MGNAKCKVVRSPQIDRAPDDPERLWEEWFASGKCVSQKIDVPVKLDEPIYSDKVRFVCVSDTHGRMDEVDLPDGDVFIHCGDFTNIGEKKEIEDFNKTIGKLPHRYKIVIAGNHELGFDETEDRSLRRGAFFSHYGTSEGHKLLTNCTFLQDQSIELYGIKIYGTAWHPLSGFAFYRHRGKPIVEKWNLIPEDIDILLTHTPPLGHGDSCRYNHAGDFDLLQTIEKRVRPKFHVFGHIHDEPGVTTNGETIFINASICDNYGRVANKPILFDVPLKEGCIKSE